MHKLLPGLLPRTLFFLLAIVWLAGLHSATASAQEIDSLALKRGANAAWRSLFVPGWGQAYNGEWIKAAVVLGGEAALLLSVNSQHQTMLDWGRKRDTYYFQAEHEEDEQQNALLLSYAEASAERADFYRLDRNKLIWWWGFSHLASVLDAYVCGAMSNFDDSWNERLEFGSAISPGGTPTLTLSWKLGGGR